MGYLDCRTFNERPPSIDSPNTADESNPHHGSPATKNNYNLQSTLQSFSTGPQSLAISREVLWPKGTTLNVVFLSTWKIREPGKKVKTGTGKITQELTDAVEKYSKLWEPHCTIRFTFDPKGKSDIRVGFGAESGHWSTLGKSALDFPADERTMNLEFNDKTPDSQIKGTTLHEFGHVLGCIHEHQSPSSPIKWNAAAVRAKLSGYPNYWDDATIKHNVLNMNTDPLLFISSRFDPDSIMLYQFDASWMTNPECTKDSKGTHENFDLSELDKRTIKEMYPLGGPQTGRFSTPTILTTSKRLHQNPRNILVSKPDEHSPPPKIAVGLSSLNVGAGSNVRIRTSADNIGIEDFFLHVDTWGDTKFDYAACNWLETPYGSCFQIGSFNTMERRPWNALNPPAETEADVKFKDSFNVIPKIVVWLNWIDTNKAHDTSVKAYATDITVSGFKIHVDTWGDCIMSSGGASWIAYPPTSTIISSDVIKTTKDPKITGYEKTGSIAFEKDQFKRQPNALIAVTSIDFAQGKDVHFDALVEEVKRTGMEWRINSSPQSSCRGIDATYIVY